MRIENILNSNRAQQIKDNRDRLEPRDGLAYGEIGRFPGGPIGRWAGELLTPPTQNLSNTISELGPHLYHVNTVERSKI